MVQTTDETRLRNFLRALTVLSREHEIWITESGRIAFEQNSEDDDLAVFSWDGHEQRYRLAVPV